MPNPESALNEEAGKLLLENYDEYFSRAKLYTEVHARVSSSQLKSSQYSSNDPNGTSNGTNKATTSSSSSNPLDSNKTINTNQQPQSQQSTTSDMEPSMKMAKLQPAAKKNDKKKALKRL